MAEEERALQGRIKDFQRHRADQFAKRAPDYVLTKSQKKQIKKKLQKKKKEMEQNKGIVEQIKIAQEPREDDSQGTPGESQSHKEEPNQSQDHPREAKDPSSLQLGLNKQPRKSFPSREEQGGAREAQGTFCEVGVSRDEAEGRQRGDQNNDLRTPGPHACIPNSDRSLLRNLENPAGPARQGTAGEQEGLRGLLHYRLKLVQSEGLDFTENQKSRLEFMSSGALLRPGMGLNRGGLWRRGVRSLSLQPPLRPHAPLEKISLATRSIERLHFPRARARSELTRIVWLGGLDSLGGRTGGAQPAAAPKATLPETRQCRKAEARREETHPLVSGFLVNDKNRSEWARLFGAGKQAGFPVKTSSQKLAAEQPKFGKIFPATNKSPIFSGASDSLARGEASVRICGFANVVSREEARVRLIQTRPYRAPEVIMKMIFGPSADIWSLGCVVFRLLTGHHLFGLQATDFCSRNTEQLIAIFRTCRKISRVHLFASPDREKLNKILNKVLDSPILYPRVSVKRLLLDGSPCSEEELAPLVELVQSCLEFVSMDRGTAAFLLRAFFAVRESKVAELKRFMLIERFLNPQVRIRLPLPLTQEAEKDAPPSTESSNVGGVRETRLCPSGPNLEQLLFSSRTGFEPLAETLERFLFGPTKDDELPETEDLRPSSFRNLSLSENSLADQEDFNQQSPEAKGGHHDPRGGLFGLAGRQFESGLHNFEELRKTCDRSFINQTLYIGDDVGIEVDQIDVREPIESDDSD